MEHPIRQLPPIKSTELQGRMQSWANGLAVIGSPLRPPAVPLNESAASPRNTPNRPRTMLEMLQARSKTPSSGPERAVSRVPGAPKGLQPSPSRRTPENDPVMDEGLSRGAALVAGMSMFKKKVAR